MSREVRIAGTAIGGNNRIRIQTMCNTPTRDVEASVAQIKEMVNAGAEIVRLTTQGKPEVEALSEIKKRLKDEGITVPLVADIHFNSEVAMEAAKVADKVRINPGNFAKSHEKASSEFRRLIGICREHGTAIRIGLNHGSLGERIVNLYGDTPEGMKEAAMEWIEMAVKENFLDIVISLKASNTVIMTQAYRLLRKAMAEKGYDFPLHLGVTEAGNGDSGRIKSAVGLASLLDERIGDTIRVSLTENPVNELPVAKFIADYYDSMDDEALANKKEKAFKVTRYNEKSREDLLLRVSCDYGPALLDRRIDDFDFTAEINGKEIECGLKEHIKDEIMQAARRRFYKPEYIACPGCGRTQFNLEKTFNEVKERTSHLKGMTIAVMGCIVNGPGEMADAQFGYVGEGAGKVAIYKGKTPVLRSVPQEEAIDKLLQIIENSTNAE